MFQQELDSIWNGWRIEELIGQGSYGKVYHISKKEFNNTYHSALKVIRIPKDKLEYQNTLNGWMSEKETEQYYDTLVQEIVKEIMVMSKLKGITNIVSYEDHAVIKAQDSIGWTIYIRMELLTPLYEYFKSKTITKKDIIKLGIDICKALEVCQKYSIIHRDIKPDNIFISDLGDYKLGDFGIARQMEGTLSSMSTKGTYLYMAPEVYKGEKYDSTVDLYSLGIVLYRFLNNNRTPFMPPASEPIRHTDTQKSNLKRIGGGKIPKPVNADERLAEIVLKACSYNPEDRYQNAEDFRRALESVFYEKDKEEYVNTKNDPLEFESNEYINDSGNSSNENGERNLHKTEERFEATESIFETVTEVNEINDEKSNNEEKEVDHEPTVGIFGAEPFEQGPKKEKKKSKLPWLIALILLCAGLGTGGYYYYQKSLERTVPNLAGMTYEEAVSMAAGDDESIIVLNDGSEYSDTIEKGCIISQNVKAGITVKKGKKVKVIVSKGALSTVPKVIGLKKEEAENILEEAGLEPSIKEKKWSDTVKKGYIIQQSVEEGKQLEEGSEVTLTISKGVEKVKVPDVEGKSEDEATKTLKENKLKVDRDTDYSSDVEYGFVIQQSIEAGKNVKKNSVVKIIISDGPKPEPSHSSSKSSGSSKKKRKKKKNSGSSKYKVTVD